MVSVFQAGIGAINARFLRLVDSAIPYEMHSGDPDTLRRARIILSFALVLIILGLEAGIFFMWMVDPLAVVRISLALVLALVLMLCIPIAFRRSGSLALGANLVITAAYVVIIAVYSVVGGVQSPLMHWCALFPMLAALMGARRSAWVWMAISFSTLAIFIGADALGWRFMDALGLSSLEGPTLWFQRSVNVASWMGILFAVALLFEHQKDKQTTQLSDKNAELQSQMEQRHKAEQRSQYLAYYDELTGLPNRRLFLEQLNAAIDQVPRLKHTLGLLFLDLDGFKEVNDMHGHELGDKLLQQVAERLQSCVRLSDRVSHSGIEEPGNVARLGGDEFTILLNGIHGHHDAAHVGQRILERMKRSFTLGELEIFIGASIGIALYSKGGMDAGDLLRNADLAMYQAKNAGKNNFKFHEESMNTDIVTRNTMTDALRKALEDKKLELHYQPIFNARTRTITGVEGLARWRTADQNFVPTETLIQIAEESGLIIQLGNWVISEACRQYREWQEAGIKLNRIAINVSAEQFRRSNVVQIVKEALRQFNMEPGKLEIEITEGAMMVDENTTLETLKELEILGVKISLDDFGTGFSSLSYVHRFPVDTLKVDRSFVTDIENNQGSRAIAVAVIALARQLGLKVIGEGVENTSQERILLENGCDEMQGYLYCKPLPASEVVHILTHGIQAS